MILDLLFLIFIQPLVISIFFFLAPVLKYFFQNKNEKLILNLVIFSLITDLIFIKPLGFFLLITSLALFLISLLEKFLGTTYFYQKLIYLLIFNLIFLGLFLYLTTKQIFVPFLLKFLIFNIIFQLIYLFIRK
ncbi:MAG: hypothetical protein KatS3mg096_165 [Candidatus Parcubacteria bacterium]|nr:MAG: hypothetical protein KatS3mg096_165 [Candidatus Parcubacteria bacterium]